MNTLKKIKNNIKLLFVFAISIIFLNTSNVYATENEDIKNFYNSSLQNGYINMLVDIKENSKDNIEFNFLFKENILGIDYGFYTTPHVVEIFEKTGYNPDMYFDGEYACVKVNAEVKNLEALFSVINCLPFIELEGYNTSKETVFSGRLTNSQFIETRNSDVVVDKIYDTNKVIFSYIPNIISRSNTENIEDNKHIWTLSGDQEVDTEIAFLKEKSNLSIFVIILMIIGLLGLIIFIFIKVKNSNKTNNNYNDNNNYNNYY